jgi:hypothetical protein
LFAQVAPDFMLLMFTSDDAKLHLNEILLLLLLLLLQASCLVSSKVEEFMQLGGVRIEDNVFVTGSGHFNLTTAADMPKSTKEIEVVMAGRN